MPSISIWRYNIQPPAAKLHSLALIKSDEYTAMEGLRKVAQFCSPSSKSYAH